jgi:hypothetical protein
MDRSNHLPDFGHELKPTSNILTITLNSLRTYVGTASPAALSGICGFVIHHAVETLRRAGLADDARRMLLGEVADLDMTRRLSRPANAALHVVDGGKQ